MTPDQTDIPERAQTNRVAATLASRPRPRGRFGDPNMLVAIFVGGIIGALLRAALTKYIPGSPNGFPWTVLTINVSGAIILTYIAVRLQERLPPSTYRRPLIGTGFCGALTTFSTMQVAVVRLGKNGHVGLGVLYLAASICLGIAAVLLTSALTRRAQLR